MRNKSLKKVPVESDGRLEPDSRLDGGMLQRSFHLLSILIEAPHPLTLREIAEAAKLRDSTAHRLLQGLCEVGYVTKSGNRRYSAVGKAFLPLTIYHPFNCLRRDVYDTLCGLRDLYGLTASALILIGTERLLLEVAGSPGVLAPHYATQLENPLHASAVGKLILQRLSPAERDRVLGPEPYKDFTPHTKINKKALDADLEQTAKQGFATSIDENFVGLSAIAAPLFAGPEQIVGALALVGPSLKFGSESVQRMGAAIQNSAKLISIGSPAIRAVRAMFAPQGELR